MIAKMSKVEIVGPKRNFDPVLHLLQDKGELHIEEVPLGEHEGKFLLHRMHINESLEKEKALLENLMYMIEEVSQLGSRQRRDNILHSSPTETKQLYETDFPHP